MPKFKVSYYREDQEMVWTKYRIVGFIEADSEEDAKQRVMDGEDIDFDGFGPDYTTVDSDLDKTISEGEIEDLEVSCEA